MESLGGCDVDTIGERGDDKSRTVPQIFVGVPHGGISNPDDSIIEVPMSFPIELQLRLPLESIDLLYILCIKLLDNIS